MSDSQEQEIGSKHSQQACHGALVLLGEVLLPQWTTCTITCHLINPFQYLILEGKKKLLHKICLLYLWYHCAA